jgi:RecA/RadA recombinase
MAKETKKDDNVMSPEEQAKAFFNNKERKSQHYNFEKTHSYKTKSSSLKLTCDTDGGLSAGAHRFMGTAETGKTSCALDFMYNFFKERKSKRRGIYVKAEGRLSDNVILRSGIKFVTTPDEWTDGTTLIVESNIFEFVFDFLNHIVKTNETETEYFIIIDSMDMLIKEDDMDKPTNKSLQVAGGAVMTATFLKKSSLILEKKGHTCIFISQYRETIRADANAPAAAPRQGTASGGHAAEHGANWAFEFLKPRKWKKGGDVIYENDDENGEVLGHVCRIKVHKSPNETTGREFSYPVRYKQVGAKSVWIERELVDLMLGWGWIEVKGAGWMNMEKTRLEEIKKNVGIDFPEKIQGMPNLYKILGENEKLCEYLFEVFTKQISLK